MLLQVHRRQKSSLPEWLRGWIHCTQVRMGSNPIADTVLQQDHVGTTARWCCTSRASAESLIYREGEFGNSEHSWGSA